MLVKTFGTIKNVKYSKRIAVRAIVLKDGKIVLNKNLEGNFYELPGGGKEKETLSEALKREVKEETGLKVVTFKKLCEVNEIVNNKIVNKFCISHGYVCNVANNSKIKPEKGLVTFLVTPQEAIKLIKNSTTKNPLAKYAQVRDIYLITQYLKIKK